MWSFTEIQQKFSWSVRSLSEGELLLIPGLRLMSHGLWFEHRFQVWRLLDKLCGILILLDLVKLSFNMASQITKQFNPCCQAVGVWNHWKDILWIQLARVNVVWSIQPIQQPYLPSISLHLKSHVEIWFSWMIYLSAFWVFLQLWISTAIGFSL